MVEFDFFLLNMGGAALVGGIAGFAAKKILKIIVILIGAQIAFLALLDNQGVITVNWDRIGGALNNSVEYTPKLMDYIISTGIISAGFGGGFAVGFYKG